MQILLTICGGLMRDPVKHLVKICAENLPLLELIYEFGSLQVPSQVEFADLRRFFPNKKYVSVDMQKGPGVDMILNLHTIDFPSKSVGDVGFKNSMPDNLANDFKTKLRDWKCYWSDASAFPDSAWKMRIKLIISPIFLNIFRKIKRYCLND